MRIASVNFYVFNKTPDRDVKRLQRENLDVIGFQEAQNDLHNIRKGLPNHRILWSERRPKWYGAREVAVALKRGTPFIDSNAREVSDLEPGEERKVFKSRWITVVKFKKHGRKCAIINYHGNATLQDKRTGKLLRSAQRVQEWLEASVIIERRIKRLQKRGYQVFVTGDWNYRNMKSIRGFRLDYFSPQRIFARCNLEFMEHGLDYVAWPESWKIAGYEIIHHEQHGGDHDWLIVEVYPKGA